MPSPQTIEEIIILSTMIIKIVVIDQVYYDLTRKGFWVTMLPPNLHRIGLNEGDGKGLG